MLLFLPWSWGLRVGDVKVRNSKQDLTFGDIDADNELSILDILRVEEATDVLDLTLDDDEAAAALKEQGKSARERINEFIGVTKDIEITKGMKLPTGVVAMAPQLLCILLMVIFYIIGVIRVFAAETAGRRLAQDRLAEGRRDHRHRHVRPHGGRDLCHQPVL